ncbi:MAG: tRNA (adenosine(37)-N6)-dimethylallyltransferase MiaA [Ruminococcaceae bacterium]|nr:tRNA (adenosine(37)-N6)-dimethylallyltransferase MiaA [Oscillospiraceae bacterium]
MTISLPKPRILAVVGCTAGGKTSLAIELAKQMNGEIVSCDSMQIYKGMNIGTATPDEAERCGIPHHLMDFVDPADSRGYSCADYVQDARAAVLDIQARGKLPILCGGTGLYLDAFLRGGSFEVTDSDPALRAELCALADREGPDSLHAILRKLDPESAEAIHPNNVKRVARAIEICRTTGRKKSDLDRESREFECPYDATVIGLHYNDRQLLYDRIDRRVDLMLEQGLVEETKRLRDAGVFEICQTAAQAIGYKELFPYLEGTATLAECSDVLKMATRRYAKRQLTWFRAKPYVQWVECDTLVDGRGIVKKFEDIVNNAKTLFK